MKALQAALLLAIVTVSGPASGQPGGLFGDSSPRFLAVDEAFSFYTSLDAADQISVHWTIAPEYYLYQDKFSFALVMADGSRQPVHYELPAGISHHDEFFGDVEVYYQSLRAALTLPGEPASGAVLEIQYQGCAEAGLCYPPQTRRTEISP